MILNISGRTDIVAFYSKWFINRYREGYVDVRNPFNPKLVSRINFEDVDAILFCTKNPIPILKYLDEIEKPIIFHITLTSYKNDVEPNVPPKGNIIAAIREISNRIGIDNVFVRYDPILINDKYNLEYHKKAFENMCRLLSGYINKIIVSFIDDYKNVRKNKDALKYKEFTEFDYQEIGKSFSTTASRYNMTVQTCFEENNLIEYGFVKDECLSSSLAYVLTGKKYKKSVLRKGNKCECVQTVDIGEYNTCRHFCKYCYANYDEEKVNQNYFKHNPNSSLLIGELTSDDIIKIRKR